MLETAVEAARRAGEILKKYFEMTSLVCEFKDDKSFVTKADRESEEAIVALIRERFPEHGIVGEEGSYVNPQAEYKWVIDPLDGTANFVNGIPICAVSIAIIQEQMPLIGVIYNPITNSLSYAERGKGAFYNGENAGVSCQEAMQGIVTFGPSPKREDKEHTQAMVHVAREHFKSYRYLGSTAAELSYVARGGTESYICIGLHQWDYAAGQLLVLEAGGKITDYEGKPCDLTQNYFIASNGVAHDAALALVHKVY